MANSIRRDIEVPITAGIDQFSDPKQSPGLLTSLNVFINRNGEIQRRNGLNQVTTSLSVSGGDRNASAEINEGIAVLPFSGHPLLVGRDHYDIQASPNVQDAVSGPAVFGLLNTDSDSDWAVLGEHAHFHQTIRNGPVFEPSVGYTEIAYSRIGDVEAFVWITPETGPATQGVYYAVRNVETDIWVKSPTRVATAAGTPVYLSMLAPHVDGSTTNRAFLFAYKTSSIANLEIHSIDPDTGALSAATSIQTNLGPRIDMGLVTQSDGSEWATMVIGDNPGVPAIYLYAFTGDKVQKANCTTNLTPAGGDWVAIMPTTFYDAGRPNFWIAVYDISVPQIDLHLFPIAFNGGSPRAPITTATFSTLVPTAGNMNSFTAISGHYLECDSVDGGTGIYQWLVAYTSLNTDASAAALYNRSTFVTFGRTDMLTGATRRASVEIPHCILYNKPFLWKRRFWLPLQTCLLRDSSSTAGLVANNLILQEMRFVGSYDTLTMPQAMVVSGELGEFDISAYGFSGRKALQDSVVAANTVDFPIMRLSRLVGARGNVIDSPATQLVTMNQGAAVRLDSAVAPPQYVSSGKDLILGGPMIRHIDGLCHEVGFLQRPEIVSATGVDTGGSLTQTGDYTAAYVFEWTDMFGQVHTSSPSESIAEDFSVLAGSNNKLDLVMNGLVHSTVPPIDGISASSGSTSKRFDSRLVIYRTEDDGAVFRRSDDTPRGQLTADAQAIETASEIASDSAISDNALLYTDFGELLNDPPPGGKILLSHKNRVLLVPDSNPNTIWVSKERLQGVGLSFNADSVINVPGEARITGLAALDDYYVVFQENSISIFSGAGPSSTGIGNFSPLQNINSGVGCRDSNSVVSFDAGVLFKSEAGWYLLDRSLGVQEVGLPVRDFDAFEVYRAVHVPSLHHIYILHKPADSTDLLVFDTLRMRWDTRRYVAGVVGTLADIANVDEVLHVAGADGKVWKETNTGAAEDDASAFNVTLTSQWLNQDDLVGVESVNWVKILGEWPASGDLTAKFYYDYAAAAAETVTVDVTDIDADGVLRIKPARGQCKAFKVELSGAIYRISKVTLEVKARPGRIGRVSDLTSS